MSVNKIIALTIAVNFFIFGQIQIASADNFTLDKYLGRWYQIATILHIDSIVSCQWFNVTRGDHGNGSFNTVYEMQFEGDDVRLDVFGNVTDSELHVTHTLDEGTFNMVYTIESYNDDQDLMLVEKENQANNQLISRTPTASAEARMRFETQATTKGERFVYVRHSNCSYNDN